MATGDRQALVKALLGRIEEARGMPDMRLPGERELAGSFGASRASVREDLGVLEAMPSIEEHERILESVAKRNIARAVRLMKKRYAGSSARWKKAHAAL